MFADDQIFRLTSLAFAPPDGEADRRVLVAAMRKAGLNVTVNNLWILAGLARTTSLPWCAGPWPTPVTLV